MREISAATARRVALASQGFVDARPMVPPTRRHIVKALGRTQLLQLDSVSVAVRAHYAPLFSRIGSYDRTLLDEAAWSHTARKPRLLVEYWAHEAALIPVQDWPLMRWRMRQFAGGRWAGAAAVLDGNPTLADDVLDVVAEIGPSTAGRIEQALEVTRPDRKGPWWDRSDTKVVCEALFAAGVLTVGKRVGFSRHYDLTERVLAPDVLARAVSESDAVRELVSRSAGALGVATERDLRDYYRLSRGQTEPAISDLVEEGILERVAVRGWDAPAYLHSAARIPRRVTGSALLCPFDPLIFFRPRVERIFDFHYRIEIYTPEHKRVHGYYVFPFLMDGELVARVDLKADRATGRLQVPGAFLEPGHHAGEVAERLGHSLREMALWLGLEGVAVGGRGGLCTALAGAMAGDRSA